MTSSLSLEDVIEAKKRIGGGNLNFLDILLLTKDERGIGLTDQEIRAEVDTFMFSGHDTSASGISWAIYNLARHLEIQEKCRKEVQDILGNRTEVELKDLSKMHYLTICIKKSLKIHPPVMEIGRALDNPRHFERGFGDDQLNADSNVPNGKCDGTLPPNTDITISILQLHHNPYVWTNPSEFDQERFTLDNVEKRATHAYVPVFSGPRNCIGQNVVAHSEWTIRVRNLCVLLMAFT